MRRREAALDGGAEKTPTAVLGAVTERRTFLPRSEYSRNQTAALCV